MSFTFRDIHSFAPGESPFLPTSHLSPSPAVPSSDATVYPVRFLEPEVGTSSQIIASQKFSSTTKPFWKSRLHSMSHFPLPLSPFRIQSPSGSVNKFTSTTPARDPHTSVSTVLLLPVDCPLCTYDTATRPLVHPFSSHQEPKAKPTGLPTTCFNRLKPVPLLHQWTPVHPNLQRLPGGPSLQRNGGLYTPDFHFSKLR